MRIPKHFKQQNLLQRKGSAPSLRPKNLTREVIFTCFGSFSRILTDYMLENPTPIEDGSDDEEAEPKIGYQLSILSLAQLQLLKTRQEPARVMLSFRALCHGLI